MMKILLFLAILFLFGHCQHNKLDSKKLTTASVTRDLTAVLKDSIVTPKEDTTAIRQEQKTEPLQTESPSRKDRIVTSPTESYYVIVASYPELSSAEKRLNRLVEQGYTESRIITKNNRFRVSVARYRDKEEAIRKTNDWKKRLDRDDLWVIRY